MLSGAMPVGDGRSLLLSSSRRSRRSPAWGAARRSRRCATRSSTTTARAWRSVVDAPPCTDASCLDAIARALGAKAGFNSNDPGPGVGRRGRARRRARPSRRPRAGRRPVDRCDDAWRRAPARTRCASPWRAGWRSVAPAAGQAVDDEAEVAKHVHAIGRRPAGSVRHVRVLGLGADCALPPGAAARAVALRPAGPRAQGRPGRGLRQGRVARCRGSPRAVEGRGARAAHGPAEHGPRGEAGGRVEARRHRRRYGEGLRRSLAEGQSARANPGPAAGPRVSWSGCTVSSGSGRSRAPKTGSSSA